ncbi:hypothetical protein J6590_081895 [Homalodisca vitripennis]|nr:hypothetical protein J6590_081895 [Homalodisca vitripennis]
MTEERDSNEKVRNQSNAPRRGAEVAIENLVTTFLQISSKIYFTKWTVYRYQPLSGREYNQFSSSYNQLSRRDDPASDVESGGLGSSLLIKYCKG